MLIATSLGLVGRRRGTCAFPLLLWAFGSDREAFFGTAESACKNKNISPRFFALFALVLKGLGCCSAGYEHGVAGLADRALEFGREADLPLPRDGVEV